MIELNTAVVPPVNGTSMEIDLNEIDFNLIQTSTLPLHLLFAALPFSQRGAVKCERLARCLAQRGENVERDGSQNRFSGLPDCDWRSCTMITRPAFVSLAIHTTTIAMVA